jgi:hypothetical protein
VNENLGIDPRKAAEYAEMIRMGNPTSYDNPGRAFVFFWTRILGMPIHQGQLDWCLESLKQDTAGNWLYKFCILSPSNQWGKDIIMSGINIWDAFYKERLRGFPEEAKATAEYPMLYISPHSSQIDRAFKYVTQIVAGEFVWEVNGVRQGPNKSMIKWAIIKKAEAPMSVTFFNGAEIFFRPTGEDKAGSVAASPYARITYTEACRSYHLQTEFDSVLLPRTTKFRAQIQMPSTPHFDSPSFMYFKKLYDKGRITKTHPEREVQWFSMGGDLYQNDFLPETEKRVIEAATDPETRRQTIYGEFVGNYNSNFDIPMIENIFSDITLAFEPRNSDFEYIIVWDPAFGKYDNSVWHVYKRLPGGRKFQLVRREAFRGHTVSPEGQFSLATSLWNDYNKGDFVFDGSGPQGLLIQSKLSALNPTGINFAQVKDAILPELKDFLSSGRTTTRGVDGVQREAVVDYGRIRAPYVAAIAEELGAYPGPDKDQKAQCDEVAVMGLLAHYVDKVTASMESYDVDVLAL